jgi:hypothetical protein
MCKKNGLLQYKKVNQINDNASGPKQYSTKNKLVQSEENCGKLSHIIIDLRNFVALQYTVLYN